ncbi:MAG: hypothetical protein U1F61_11745 [Opitutaceae bacterium]
MPSPRLDAGCRAARWLLPTALVALAPKCALCLIAYIGLGTALGLSGPELCGASNAGPNAWASWLAWLGVCGAVGALGLLAVRAGRARLR